MLRNPQPRRDDAPSAPLNARSHPPLPHVRSKWIEDQKKPQNRFKKKDEKLDKLKDCMDVLDDPDSVRADFDWEKNMYEAMQTILGPDELARIAEQENKK